MNAAPEHFAAFKGLPALLLGLADPATAGQTLDDVWARLRALGIDGPKEVDDAP